MTDRIANGLTEVTETEFYTVMNPRNVHPRSERDRSDWVDQNNHNIIGKSEPGYASPHGTPHRYWVRSDLAQVTI